MKIRTLITIAISILAAINIFGEELKTDYLELVDRANKYAAEGDYDAAETNLIEALRLEPTNSGNVMLLSNLGMIRFYAGKDSLALETLTDAHNMAPRSVTILHNRAKVYLANHRTTEAKADLDNILELDSIQSEARFYRAMLALQLADTLAASRDLRILERDSKTNKFTNLGWGTYLSSLGRFREAIPYYTRLLETYKEPEFYGARALCLLMTGSIGDAAEDIALGLEKNPADGELYFYRAMLNKMRFRPDDAAEDAKRAISLGIDPQRIKAAGL